MRTYTVRLFGSTTMKHLVVVPALFISVSSAFGSDQPGLTSEQALRAIAIFGGDPLGEHSQAMASGITRFARDSDEVEVVILESLYPWLGDDKEVTHSSLLLSAIIAGNVRSQLETRTVRNDPYCAMLFLFRVYQEIQATDRDFRVPTIEEQLRIHREGKLFHYIREKLKEGKKAKDTWPNSKLLD